MKYLIVSGSARPDGQALRIATWIERHFPESDETALLDINEAYVPWDASALWNKDSDETHRFAAVRAQLEWCDGLIVVSPEWHGMTPGKLIAFFQAACTGATIAHKPGLIIGESSTWGGAYPEVIIRGFTSKNARINWIPEHLLIRFNEDKFKDEPKTDEDRYIQKRARYCIDLLRRYTMTLAPAREELMKDFQDFPNGM